MADGTHTPTLPWFDGNAAPTLVPAAEAAAAAQPRTTAAGLRYAVLGDPGLDLAEVRRVAEAVPSSLAAALADHVFYFVPLALPQAGRGAEPHTAIATAHTPALAEEAVCHRAVAIPEQHGRPAHEGIFLSCRILRDTFGLAFELFINVAHAFAARAGVPEGFATLLWTQAEAGIRGETSQDAAESRADALKPGADPKFKAEYLETAFADALAIYQLSLAVDFDYAELREREYPLLAPAALAERLRLAATLHPANSGYEFSIRYRRR